MREYPVHPPTRCHIFALRNGFQAKISPEAAISALRPCLSSIHTDQRQEFKFKTLIFFNAGISGSSSDPLSYYHFLHIHKRYRKFLRRVKRTAISRVFYVIQLFLFRVLIYINLLSDRLQPLKNSVYF